MGFRVAHAIIGRCGPVGARGSCERTWTVMREIGKTVRGWRALSRITTIAACLGCAAAMPADAAAQAVGCGAVLTVDTTLTADITGCRGSGLIIGASGITVDLGGHTVSGLASQGGDPAQVGIDDSAGYDRVTIRNGSVGSFEHGGVQLADADGTRLEQLHVELSGEFGILVDGGSGNVIRDNDLAYPGQLGIAVRGDARETAITGNRVVFPGSAGIVLERGPIADTTIDGNEVTSALADERPGGGILVGRDDARVTGTTVRGNNVHNNYERGILIGARSIATNVTRNTLTDNTFTDVENGGTRTTIQANRMHDDLGLTGVAVRNQETAVAAEVAGNSIRGIGNAGIDDSGTRSVVRLNAIDGRLGELTYGFLAGIVVRPDSRAAQVVANAVTHQNKDGITVSGRGTVVSANVVAVTLEGDGIRVEADADDVLLHGNVASHHQDDGIEAASPTTTLARNLAIGNGDLGIIAAPGVTDNGGNRAARNGNPAQCSGVACLVP